MIYSAALIQDSETSVVVDITGHGVYAPDKDLYVEAMTRTRPDLYQEVKAVTDAMGITGISKLPKFALAAMVADWKTATMADKQARAELAAQQAKELVDQVAPVVEESQPVNVYVHWTGGTTDSFLMHTGSPATNEALESFIRTRGESDHVATITMDAQADCSCWLIHTWVPGPLNYKKSADLIVDMAMQFGHLGNGPHKRELARRLLDALFQIELNNASNIDDTSEYSRVRRQYRIVKAYINDEFAERGVSSYR